MAGTVVDTSICDPHGFDFYLYSDASVEGTSYYHVLHDDNGFSFDRMQLMTYSLSYTYGRDTCSTSTVASIYYARLAAERARCYIQAADSERLPSVPTAFEKKHPMFYC